MPEIATALSKPPISKLPKITAGFCQFPGDAIAEFFCGEYNGWVCRFDVAAGEKLTVGVFAANSGGILLVDCKACSILLAVL